MEADVGLGQLLALLVAVPLLHVAAYFLAKLW